MIKLISESDSSFQIFYSIEVILKLNQSFPEKFYSLLTVFDLIYNQTRELQKDLIIQVVIYKLLKILLFFNKNFNYNNFEMITFLFDHFK